MWLPFWMLSWSSAFLIRGRKCSCYEALFAEAYGTRNLRASLANCLGNHAPSPCPTNVYMCRQQPHMSAWLQPPEKSCTVIGLKLQRVLLWENHEFSQQQYGWFKLPSVDFVLQQRVNWTESWSEWLEFKNVKTKPLNACYVFFYEKKKYCLKRENKTNEQISQQP